MTATPPNASRKIGIDFLYIDLDTCTRCKGTDANITEALDRAASLLEGAGIQVSLHKTLVDSEEKARALGFVSSPTIRVNGQDIALELRESRCDACGELSGCDEGTDCRIWVYQGEEYTAAPVPLIVDAILSAAHATEGILAPEPGFQVPLNLRRFFEGKAAKVPSSCCAPASQTHGGCGCP